MHSLRPKKALGQNFLIDQHVLSRIATVVDVSPDDHILEIGPGRGALTGLLVRNAAKVVAVELDRDLVPMLKRQFADTSCFEVVQGDILDIDLAPLLKERWGGRWKVAANLPYNISSQILFKFLDNRELFSSFVVMLQKEVGDRLAAEPGGKEYGILSVLFRLHYDVRKEFTVKPGSFFPVPRVDSVILKFNTLAEARVDVGDEMFFRRVVKGAFSQRRKTLLNCLKAAGFCQDESLLVKAGIDPLRRGETLSLDEFARLSRTLQGL